jgi:hypothetical protein
VEGWISAPKPRETFLFFIGGAKERNPAAAKALAARLEGALTGPPHYDAFR